MMPTDSKGSRCDSELKRMDKLEMELQHLKNEMQALSTAFHGHVREILEEMENLSDWLQEKDEAADSDFIVEEGGEAE